MTKLASRRTAPIVSRNSASLLSLAVTMTVICYLAGLALAGLIIVDQAVDNWSRGLSQEVTVQVKVLSTIDVEQELAKALGILQSTPGVLKTEALSKSQGMRLLEPWLGTENLDDLPIPRLIRVTLDPASPPDFAILQQQLQEKVKGVVLDTHSHWRDELSRAGTKFSALALAVLALIAAAAVTLAIFGARAALESNRGVVEVLRLVGAENGFIARQINRRFFRLGLGAGLLGFLMTVATLLALGWWDLISGGVPNLARVELLSSSWRIEGTRFVYLLLVPLLSAILVTLSARITLLRLLRNF